MGFTQFTRRRFLTALAFAPFALYGVGEIAAFIRGTKANGYRDGVLSTTAEGARAVARTIINGVNNEARLATIEENADVIDGVRFVGTLDGKTCPFCGAMDGKIWSVDALVDVRRPPLHVDCRCCLVPHIEPRDKDGNVLELGERPAANADFDKLAEEQYNADARKKGLKRRFKDLAPSTRLKYYYQAQKDFEKRTGKPAYRQVSTKTTFKEYFERQPEAFKRAWLGRNRFEAYKNGTLKIDDYLNPNRFYTARVVDLKPARDLKDFSGNLNESNYNESSSINRIQWTESQKLQQEIQRNRAFDSFGIDADYSNISPDVAEAMNDALLEARSKLGSVGAVEKIRALDIEKCKSDALGRYSAKEKTIFLRSDLTLKQLAERVQENFDGGFCSTSAPNHSFRHEIGHSIHDRIEKEMPIWYNHIKERLIQKFAELSRNPSALSIYALDDIYEMIAESVAAFLNGDKGFGKDVTDILLGKK